MLPLELAVHKGADDQGVDHGDRRAFAGRGDAEGGEHQDHDRHQQGDQTVYDDLFPAAVDLGFDFMIAALFRNDPDHRQLEQADQDAGDDAAHKQLADRHPGDHSEHQHRDGRRDDHADGGGGDGDAGGELVGIALLVHVRDQDGAQGGGIGHGGAGDAAEDHGGDHVDLAQAAPEGLADQQGEVDQPLGQAAVVHQFARQHEQGHGDQDVGIQAGKDPLGQHHQEGGVIRQEIQDARPAQGIADRHADQDKEHKRSE